MIKTPHISIIVPVYNVELYLATCINSLINQTFSDIEILLVDDGSLDGSGNICDKYASEDSRIRVFHTSNNGVTFARKTGTENAQGEWICFVDSDDTMPLDALSQMLHMVGNCDMLKGDHRKIHNIDASSSQCSIQQDLIQLQSTDFICECLKNWKLRGPWGSLYKRKLFDNSIFDLPRDIVRGEDYIMNVRLGNKAKQIAVTTSIVYNYFDRPGSCMNTFIPTLQYEKQFEKYLVATLDSILNSKEIKEALFYHRYAVIKTLYLTNKKLDTKDTYITELIKNTRHLNLSKEDNIIRHLYKYLRLAKTSLKTLRILHNLKEIIKPS